MHPLFLAHIVSDFLLQPAQLVQLKIEKARGVVLHSLIHAAVMFFFIFPLTPFTAGAVAGIAALHGLIDAVKIRYQRKNPAFRPAFILDQLAHFLVLLAAAKIVRFNISAWQTASSLTAASLLFLFSYALAIRNIKKRIILISMVFTLFFIAGMLLAS